jgi:UDP-N-acetylmuramate--alanine ligase
MVGIGGTGLSALARYLLAAGDEVSGCDLKESETTGALQQDGATVLVGHDPAHLVGQDLVVYTNVTSPTEEVEAARQQRLNLVHRAELLAGLVNLTDSIAVAGSHGKTTVTYMVGHILVTGGEDPTILVGDGLHSRAGRGPLVAEADESDGTLTLHHPRVAVVTNVEFDHPDYFPDLDSVRDLFTRFLAGLPADGLAVLGADDTFLSNSRSSGRCISYGFTGGDYRCTDERPFTLSRRGDVLGRVDLRVPGRHNIQNATAAAAVALERGVDFEIVSEALASFPGAHRRLEYVGGWRGALVYDDYGHHPTEVAATVQAARELTDRHLVLVFQPHRFTRWAALGRDFVDSFGGVDRLVVTEIYPAGEQNSDHVSASVVTQWAPGAAFAPDFDRVKELLERMVQPGDLVLFMGAGDITRLAHDLADAA